jgi:IS5 family transposase
VLRQFARAYLARAPDDTALIRWAKLVGPATLAALNGRAVGLARSLKVTRGRKLRVDTSVVEADIRHPTDSGLLGDGVRVLSRLLRRARSAFGAAADLGAGAFRTRTRSARRAARELHRLARRKGEAVAEQMRDAYRRLIAVAEASRRQAAKVAAALRDAAGAEGRRLLAQFGRFPPLVERAIAQATRRALGGESVPAKEKVLSLFEPGAQVIVRRKAGKPAESGRKLWLDEVEGGIVSRYALLPEVGPADG